MKRTCLLLAASIFPLTLTLHAQPAPTPPTGKLERIQFEGASLQEMVDSLQAQASGNPSIPDLNVVVSKEVADLRIPTLLLRHVSPADVLAVATRLLNVQMEPVFGDEGGPPVAYLLKQAATPVAMASSGMGISLPGGGGGAPVAPGSVGPSPAAGAAPTPPPASAVVEEYGGSNRLPAPEAAIPQVTTVYTSPPAGRPAVRVFGIAPLIKPNGGLDILPEELERRRNIKLENLVSGLQKLSDAQRMEAEVQAYAAMDIIVVRSVEPAALALIGETIDAMKANLEVAPDGHTKKSVQTH